MKAVLVLILLTGILSESGGTPEPQHGKAAVIIDDFGGTGKGTEEFLSADFPVTAAVMPFMENSYSVAEAAQKNGLEVIIHLPMEPKKEKRSWLGPKPVLEDLPLEEVQKRVHDAIKEIPQAKGINQHMGSKIVENEEIMRAVLEEVANHNLYVLDSGTSPASVIPGLCEEMGIPYAKRDLFLDDTTSSEIHVYSMSVKLADFAAKTGKAVGIGHVGIKGQESFKGLQKAIPYFKENNVEIVPLSFLIESEIEKDPEKFWQKNR